MALPDASRENALVLTKIEEAQHWQLVKNTSRTEHDQAKA